VGTENGLARLAPGELQILTTDDGLSANAIRAIACGDQGTVYVATANGGLNVITTNGVAVHRKGPGALPSDHLTSLCLDREGVLWIGSAGSGLVRFHENRWTTYTERDGLANNRIGYLLDDDTGHLWMGSSRGLMRVAISDLEEFADGTRAFVPCHRYGQEDGLPASECTSGSQPAACQTREGTLYFPTIRGVAAVNPNRIPRNPHPPPVAIESVLIDQEEQYTNLLHAPWPDRVTLLPGDQVLEVAYTSLNLAAPQRTRFRYQLEGFDAGWIDAGVDRVARYPRLPPGDYVFRIGAANEDGVWNESGATIAVVVLPPFWRTTWFLTLTGALILGAVAGTVHLISTQRLKAQLARLRQQEALERERARISRDLHDQLGANLTQVALLGELAEADKDLPDEVGEHARHISQTARETTRALDEIVWAANPANDTLDGLVNYVCKYAQEFLALARVRYRLDAPSTLPPVRLQPELRHNVFLAAKEAINNVVKHAQASEARVRLELKENQFTFEIADNGVGPAGGATAGERGRNGLSNMRKRMEDIGGTFSFEPGVDGGSIVRLSAPLRPANTRSS
jgi:signal transduction histidine kinase